MFSVKVLLYLAAALTACQSLPTELEVAEDPSRIFENYITYSFWTYERNIEDYRELKVKLSEFPALRIPANSRITVLVHGKKESTSHTVFFSSLRRAFLQRLTTYAVIEVDWYLISGMNLSDEFVVEMVGKNLADLLKINPDIDPRLVHLVGFDLGAHIVGYASRNTGFIGLNQIRKITALSPVGTITRNSPYCLRAGDAAFVEAIHSDVVGTRAIGTAELVGTVDIYLNTGTNQPNCRSVNTCNHQYAIDVFVATVEQNGHLSASGCSAFADVTRNRCTLLPTIRLGSDSIADKVASGIYRATTGATYPYTP